MEYLKKDIESLEKVQKLALKVCSTLWSYDYDTVLDTFSLP